MERPQVKAAMLDSANDSIRRLKAALAAAEAASATARGETGAAARAAEEADAQLAEREAEIADFQCEPPPLDCCKRICLVGWSRQHRLHSN